MNNYCHLLKMVQQYINEYPLTEEQFRRNIIRLYNGGYRYYFDVNYTISEDGLNLTEGETLSQIEADAGHRYSNGNTNNPNPHWKEININPNYVDNVENC